MCHLPLDYELIINGNQQPLDLKIIDRAMWSIGNRNLLNSLMLLRYGDFYSDLSEDNKNSINVHDKNILRNIFNKRNSYVVQLPSNLDSSNRRNL